MFKLLIKLIPTRPIYAHCDIPLQNIQKPHGRSIFVVGDNRKESTDSRKFGWIKKEQIIGKVIWY